MKKSLLSKFWLLLLCLVAGVNSAWAGTVTFTAGTDTSEGTSITKNGITISFSQGVFNRTDNYRCYSGASMTISSTVGNITQIDFTATSSNPMTKFSGNPDVGSWTNNNKTQWIGSATEINFGTTSGQARIEEIVVIYEEGGSSSDLALTNAPIALSFDLYNNSDAQVISYTTSSTGEITVSDSEYIETSVDTNNQTITVTPKKKTSGAQTITVTQAEDGTYSSGTATFTVTITDSTPKTGGWIATDLADLAEGDVFVIVGNNGNTYAMSNNNGTSNAPAAVAITIENDEITRGVADNIQWNISGNAEDGYTFYPNGTTETWLYCTNTNNGVRVGTNNFNTFVIKDGYLYHNGTSRYVGIYSSQDWRCYTTINSNIKDQTLAFYKYVDNAVTVKAPVITVAEEFIGSTTATITCATEGATIYYSYDNVNWTEYTSELTITETTTIYAKAEKDEVESSVVSKTTTKTLPTPTVTIDATGITNTNIFTGTNAGTLSATVTYNDAAIEGATVTWSSSNDEVATINATTGAVTLVAAGSVTFTATFAGNGDYTGNTATYQMIVTNNDPDANDGSEEKPYTVAEAIAFINTLGSSTSTNDVYVSGIISQIDSYSSQYSSITYWISDDGTTENQMEVFGGKGLDGADFSSVDDLEVGDVVTVKGKVKMYNSSTPEFDSDNQLVSLTRKEAATITVTNGTEQTVDRTQDVNSLTLTATANCGEDVVFTIDEENTTLTTGTDFSFDTESATFTFLTKKGGVIVVKASVEETAEYKAAEETITITVIGDKETPTISVQDESIVYGTTLTIDDSAIVGGDITVTSSNELVASVEGLVITAKAVGTTTITVATAETAEYKAGSETFTLTVTADETLPALEKVIFAETFDGCDYTGGRDGELSGSVGNGDPFYDNSTAWSKNSNFRGASHCLKFGTSSNNGSLTLTVSVTGNATLTFAAAGWNDTKTNTLEVSSEGATLSGDKSFTLTNGAWNNYTVNITEATGTVTLTFVGKRGFLDDVVVKAEGGNTIDVKLATSGYASYCSPYALDLTATDDYAAWAVTNVSETTVTFTMIDGAVPAKTPFILYHKDNGGQTVSLPVVLEGETTAVENNMLVGTISPTYVASDEETTYFGLSNGKFAKMNDGVVKANKAYLPLSGIPANARLTIIFEDETTGIATLQTVDMNETFYNLKGQRVETPRKGELYIVGGKKVVLK